MHPGASGRTAKRPSQRASRRGQKNEGLGTLKRPQTTALNLSVPEFPLPIERKIGTHAFWEGERRVMNGADRSLVRDLLSPKSAQL